MHLRDTKGEFCIPSVLHKLITALSIESLQSDMSAEVETRRHLYLHKIISVIIAFVTASHRARRLIQQSRSAVEIYSVRIWKYWSTTKIVFGLSRLGFGIHLKCFTKSM